MVCVLYSFNVMYYINWFLEVKPALDKISMADDGLLFFLCDWIWRTTILLKIFGFVFINAIDL